MSLIHLLRHMRQTLLFCFIIAVVVSPVAAAEMSGGGAKEGKGAEMAAGGAKDCGPIIILDKQGRLQKIVQEARCYTHPAAQGEMGCTSGSACSYEGQAGCDTSNMSATCHTVGQPNCQCKCQ